MRGTPNDNICDIHEIEDIEIILSDGCRLAARVWMPNDANSDPVPAILEYLPIANAMAMRVMLTHLFRETWLCLRPRRHAWKRR